MLQYADHSIKSSCRADCVQSHPYNTRQVRERFQQHAQRISMALNPGPSAITAAHQRRPAIDPVAALLRFARARVGQPALRGPKSRFSCATSVVDVTSLHRVVAARDRAAPTTASVQTLQTLQVWHQCWKNSGCQRSSGVNLELSQPGA